MALNIKLLIINCFGLENDPNAFDLLMFGLGSFVLISFLLFYYNRIPKSNPTKSNLDNPIYQTKDILLQSNTADVNVVIAEKITSIWAKVLVIVLILCIAFTPFQEFLGL